MEKDTATTEVANEATDKTGQTELAVYDTSFLGTSEEEVMASLGLAQEEAVVDETPANEPTDEPEEPTEEPTDEAEPTDEPAEEPTDEPEGLPASLLVEVRRRIGGVVENEEDLYQHLDRLSERDSALQQVEELYGSHPELLKIVEMITGDDAVPISVAASVIAGEVDPEPDADDDPKAYAKWYARQQETKRLQKEQRLDSEKQRERRKAASDAVTKNYEEFVRAHSLTAEEASDYAKEYSVLFGGDPVTGKRRRDEHDIIYRGLNFDRLLKAEVDKARAEMTAKLTPTKDEVPIKRGDGLPKVKNVGKTQQLDEGDLATRDFAKLMDSYEPDTSFLQKAWK